MHSFNVYVFRRGLPSRVFGRTLSSAALFAAVSKKKLLGCMELQRKKGPVKALDSRISR